MSTSLLSLDAGLAVLEVRGEVDMASSSELQQAVQECMEVHSESVRCLVIDLSLVDFLSSSGLAVLVRASERCRAVDAELRVVASSRATRRPIEATGLGSLLAVYPDRDSAISVDSGAPAHADDTLG